MAVTSRKTKRGWLRPAHSPGPSSSYRWTVEVDKWKSTGESIGYKVYLNGDLELRDCSAQISYDFGCRTKRQWVLNLAMIQKLLAEISEFHDLYQACGKEVFDE